MHLTQEIHETYICGQFQRVDVLVLINVAVENNRHVNNTPLFIHSLGSLTSRVYDIQDHNVAERNFSEMETDK